MTANANTTGPKGKATPRSTPWTIAEILPQYEAAKAYRDAHIMPNPTPFNGDLYDKLEEVYAEKVELCHQTVVLLAKTPASSISELLIKVRLMIKHELDRDINRGGKAYVEILADLERLA
jgi:hypothetical protein